MPKQTHPREVTEDDPDVQIDPEATPSLFDDEVDTNEDIELDELDDDRIEEEQIDVDDLSAMEGPDA
jgi:hypothetical protein